MIFNTSRMKYAKMGCMNKDVIYIEPEDDITDIITKIENSKEKIIALVPPKKAGVFRSIVNIKLIAKAGAASEKTIVLVTTDPSIMKLAATTKLPVTKNLQSAPVVPEAEADSEAESSSTEEIVEEADGTVITTNATVTEVDGEESAPEIAETSEEKNDKEDALDGENHTKKDKKAAKKAKKVAETGEEKPVSNNPVIAWFQTHKKLAIFGGIGGVVLILVLVWAFVVAPAATVTVGIRTTTANFSENVTFTDKLAEENIAEGKFYLEEKKIEDKSEVSFTATGTKNVGEKAHGDVVIYAFFRDQETVAVNAGTVFSYDGLEFISDKEVSLSWDGKTMTACGNNGDPSIIASGCLVSGRVAVTAASSGASYNVSASPTGWSTVADVNVYTDAAMTGGTDKTITIVQQSDIDKALSKLETSNEAVNKEQLYDTISDDAFIIDTSFKQTVGNAVSTPAVGAEVKDGEKAKLSITTTDSVYVIDNTKVEEFISEKAKLAANFKIYTMNDPFVENFTKTDSGYTGKIKTSYVSGPKVTENDVIEIIKGKGLGTAQHDLKDIDGVSTVRIDTSFPWVMSIPSDPEKITVILDIEE